MHTVRCRVPATIRLVGELDEAGWARVEDALVAQFAAVLREMERRVAAAGAAPRPPEPVRERFDPSRLRPEGYLVPAYEDGEPVAVPSEEVGAARPPDLPRASVPELRQAIRDAFPATGGAPTVGVFYGIYARLGEDAAPRLYYIRSMDTPELHTLILYNRTAVRRHALFLEPGFYTVTFVPGSTGRLVRNGETLSDAMENPDNLDVTVAFVVDPMQARPPEPPQFTFIPVMHIVARNLESPLGTGAESVYHAVTNMWRVDEQWRPQLIHPLAFVGTFPRYHWEINKLPAEDDPDQQPKLVREVEGYDAASIRHTWKEPGRYEVRCWVTVRGEDISPEAATDRREEKVVDRQLKMAMHLELLEKHEREKNEQVWATSAQELLREFEKELAAERAKDEPNEARIDYLQEVIGKLREQLTPAGPSTIGPFPVHAVFIEQKTSQVKPVSLFLAFELTGDRDEPYRWYLSDVTYPAFYRTYSGEGATVVEALLATFHDSETSFRRTYPPGHILVRVSLADLERYGIEALTGFTGRDFTFETDSWQKDAYEWLTLGVQVIGAVGLVASFVFPPSTALAVALVVTGVAGAALSVANIADRVATNSFEWDVETFADIANIAASLAQLGSLAAGARASRLATAVRSAENLTPELVASLGMATKVQRALLVTQLGTDVANGLILGWGTYQQLSMVDAEFDEASLREYQRVYGEDEGRARWQQERQNRITGILAQAAVGGTLIAVSVRGGVSQLGELRTAMGALERPAPPPVEAGAGAPPAAPAAKPPPPPSAGEYLAPGAPGPPARWNSRAELELAARTNPEAGQDLAWYDNASDAQLLAREAGDRVAKELLDERFGGPKRPYQPDRPANTVIQEKLKADLNYVRAAVETQRRRMEQEGLLEPVEPTPPQWGKRRTRAGRQAVAPTEKQLQGYQGTLAVAASDIPALAGEDFAGGSPRAMGAYDPAHPIRPGETVTVRQAHGHAEQDIGQQLHDRLARLTPQERAEASGRAIWIRVDQEVCSICAAGLGSSDRTGVLRRLSELNPDILFVITANDTSKVYRVRAGMGLP
jgi:hypothetical protein